MALEMYAGQCDTAGGRGKITPPMASITKDGAIRVNETLGAMLPDAMKRVTLGVDKESDPPKIVLKLVRDDDAVKYARHLSRCNVRELARQVMCKGFLHWAGIDYVRDGTTRYPAHYEEKTRSVVIRLESIGR